MPPRSDRRRLSCVDCRRERRRVPAGAVWSHSRVSCRKRSRSCLVIGPGLPVPISRPSHFTTGITSAAVPVRKHSSAV